MLGVYELQQRIVTAFPNILLENCASGGGRFDPGERCGFCKTISFCSEYMHSSLMRIFKVVGNSSFNIMFLSLPCTFCTHTYSMRRHAVLQSADLVQRQHRRLDPHEDSVWHQSGLSHPLCGGSHQHGAQPHHWLHGRICLLCHRVSFLRLCISSAIGILLCARQLIHYITIFICSFINADPPAYACLCGDVRYLWLRTRHFHRLTQGPVR